MTKEMKKEDRKYQLYLHGSSLGNIGLVVSGLTPWRYWNICTRRIKQLPKPNSKESRTPVKSRDRVS